MSDVREAAVWVQHHQQILQALPSGKIPHHVHPGGRHPQQEEGALLVLQAQEKAHLGSQEKQILAESHIFILVLKTLCIDQFHFLDIIVVLPDEEKSETLE